MSNINTHTPKAFAVLFKGLARWDYGYFHKISWQWPTEYIESIGRVLIRRQDEVDKSGGVEALPIIKKISFGGVISLTEQEERKGYKGRLFWAHQGDLIYSKIRVKQGSLAIVSDEFTRIAVSSEYPVYDIDETLVDSLYLKLVLKSGAFTKFLEGLSHGSSTKTRIAPASFEQLTIPLPPIDIQQAIVKRWQEAREEYHEAQERIKTLESELEKTFFSELGIELLEQIERPKFFAVLWPSLARWSVRHVCDNILGLDTLPESAYAYVPLGKVAKVSYGLQKSPANRPGQHAKPYLRVANVRKGYLDLSEIKQINVPENEVDSYRLLPGDILFVEGNGSRSELGRVAMWRGEIPECVHQNHLIKVRANQSELLPEFAMFWFNTELGRGHFFRSAKSSSGLGTINSEEVRSAPIPLPKPDVQQAIMNKIYMGQEEIRRVREAAVRKARDANAEIEALILGTKQVISAV
jgi:type I restriction enzyme, S subunit